MARAAVKAKQQQAKAKAQPSRAARKRGRRGHSGGGNPNQDLFFVRLRRRQKWIYAFLAVIFAATFAGVGVGSGNGGGLDQLYSGLFGGGGSSVSKAQDAIKKHPNQAKGYLDLATAYETKGDNAGAVTALHSYLRLKKKDADVWAELGGLELAQAQTAGTQYQAAQQASQLADPSAAFLPGGTLAQAVGTNAAYQTASQQASAQTSALYTQFTTSLSGSVKDYQKSASLQPKSTSAWQLLASVAQNAGNSQVTLGALKHLRKIDPSQRKQVDKEIKALQKSLAPASTPTVKSGNSGQK
jgi:tetratricopeptide (TPR) repeat protein